MFSRLTAAALLALATWLPVSAATVAERSPFTQGQWWDPTRSGNGFEIFNVGNQGMALWFTFDDTRNPVWYTAQGELGTTWTLLKHYRNGFQQGAAVPVGSLKLTFRDDSQADAEFVLGGRTGTWRIEPFTPGAKSNEVDHSGSYFDPEKPGWGFTLTEQGEVLGGVLYYYDMNGFPTWVAGFARNSTGSVGVVGVRGSCPGCEPGTTDRVDGGRIEIEMLSDHEAVLRTVLTNPMSPGIEIDGARLVQLGRPASQRTADRLLASFPSEPALKTYLVGAMPNMAFGGGFFGGLSPADTPLRPLRLQDSGANECDLVQSSARHVYTFGHDGVTRPMAHIRVAEVGTDGRSLDVLPQTVALASGFNTPTFAAALCLSADALVSIAGTQPYTQFGTAGSSTGYMKGRTYVEIFGLADPARPASRWWAEFEGHMLTSFRIGERLYVVLRYAPTVQGLDYRYLSSPEAMNRQILADAPLSVLTPQVRPNGGGAVAVVSPASTYLAPQGSRRRADHIAVVAIDLREARIADSLAILGSVESVHVSGNDLYLAGMSLPGTGIGNAQGTRIYQVRLGAQGMAVVGSGFVEGLGSALQAANGGQVQALTGIPTGARLTILVPGLSTPEFLRAVGSLPNASQPTPIASGRARFAGNRLYVASFGGELGVINLSDPLDPKLGGVLVTRGALESLHPLPDGRLVATGHEVGFFGIPGDLHVTLYDTRDAANPREVQRVRIASSSGTTPLAQEPYALASLQQVDGSISIAFPVQMFTAGAAESSVMHFEVRPFGTFNAGLARFPDLRATGAGFLLPDARALIYSEAVIYIGGGKFWRQDGNANVTGPF